MKQRHHHAYGNGPHLGARYVEAAVAAHREPLNPPAGIDIGRQHAHRGERKARCILTQTRRKSVLIYALSAWILLVSRRKGANAESIWEESMLQAPARLIG